MSTGVTQLLSGDYIVIANTNFSSNKSPFLATANSQPFCSDDVPGCLASGKCNGENGPNIYFYTLENLRNAVIPYLYPRFVITKLVDQGGSYGNFAKGTPIFAGDFVGFQQVQGGIIQTGSRTGTLGWDDRLALQGDSWTDDDGDVDYRVFMFVTPSGVGAGGNTDNSVPINLGTPYFIQSYGKLVNDGNNQFWKVGDIKYECAVSTQDINGLPNADPSSLFYIYDETGGGAPPVTASFYLPTWQWILIGIVFLLSLITLFLVILLMFRIFSGRKKKKKEEKEEMMEKEIKMNNSSSSSKQNLDENKAPSSPSQNEPQFAEFTPQSTSPPGYIAD